MPLQNLLCGNDTKRNTFGTEVDKKIYLNTIVTDFVIRQKTKMHKKKTNETLNSIIVLVYANMVATWGRWSPTLATRAAIRNY